MAEGERVAREVAVQREERRDRPGRAVKARQRDVRHKGARFGRDANARQALFDLAVQRRERRFGGDARPDHVRPPLPLEQADTRDSRRDRRRVERAQRRGDVFGQVVVDLADEAQRQVKLLVALPARARNAVHRAQQERADGRWRSQRDKQAVRRHGMSIGRTAACRESPVATFLSGFA